MREGEFNDGLIVAETALASIPMLVSSDDDLVGMNKDLLAACFADSDLPGPAVTWSAEIISQKTKKTK